MCNCNIIIKENIVQVAWGCIAILLRLTEAVDGVEAAGRRGWAAVGEGGLRAGATGTAGWGSRPATGAMHSQSVSTTYICLQTLTHLVQQREGRRREQVRQAVAVQPV